VPVSQYKIFISGAINLSWSEHQAYIYSIIQARFYKPFTFNSK